MIAAIAIACFTNLAGNVISATPVKIENGKVTFSSGAARCRTYVGEASLPPRKDVGEASLPPREDVGEASLPPRKKEKTIPLRAFPASEQKRIKDALDVREGRAPSRPMPGELKALAAEIAAQRARAEARAKAGRMTAEALAEYRANLAGSWAHAVETANLNEEEKSHWKGRCP